MEHETKFVAFNLEGMNKTDKLVNSLLSASVNFINEKVSKAPKDYGNLSGDQVEKFAWNSMINVAPSVDFPKERIKLISGHVFPDIILNKCNYGVEIKSTQKDSWVSTGSSIVENTRYSEADRIYMLFGKLGGTPEFRCKPYQQCLSNIAVTHSPRYLIDMNLSDDNNIFTKMHTEYDDFRILPETEKISKVRQYYIAKAKAEGKYEMPWWMGETTSVNLSFYNDLPQHDKDKLFAKACILFKSVYGSNPTKRNKQISMWLCNSYSVLCYNMRDNFTAGGKLDSINGVHLKRPYPHIVAEILKYHDMIKALLYHPDEDIILGIQEYWDFNYDNTDLYGSWLNMVETCFKESKRYSYVPIRKLLVEQAKPY